MIPDVGFIKLILLVLDPMVLRYKTEINFKVRPDNLKFQTNLYQIDFLDEIDKMLIKFCIHCRYIFERLLFASQSI